MLNRNIGITGLINRTQAWFAKTDFNRCQARFKPWEHPGLAQPVLTLGFLASSKTIVRGESNRHPKQFPNRAQLRQVLVETKPDSNTEPTMDFRRLIHYSTDNPADLVTECEIVMNVAGADNFDGYQLNVIWPDPDQIDQIRANHLRQNREIYIILQIGPEALKQYALTEKEVFAGYSVMGLTDKIKEYGKTINAVLLDPSAGRGVSLEPAPLIPVLQGMMAIDDLEVSAAGRLTAATINTAIGPLHNVCPYIGTDTQSGIRMPETDDLDLEAMRKYLVSNFQLFYPDPKRLRDNG